MRAIIAEKYGYFYFDNCSFFYLNIPCLTKSDNYSMINAHESDGFALFQYDIQEVKKIILDEKFLEVSNNVSRLFVILPKQSLLLHHEQILCVIIFYLLFRVVFTFSPRQSHDIFFLLNDFEAVREDFQVYFFSKQSAHNHSYHDQFDEPMKA